MTPEQENHIRAWAAQAGSMYGAAGEWMKILFFEIDSLREELTKIKEENRWISVEENLPKSRIWVSGYAKEDYVYAYLREDNVSWILKQDHGCEIYPLEYITHWRAIPERPKKFLPCKASGGICCKPVVTFGEPCLCERALGHDGGSRKGHICSQCKGEFSIDAHSTQWQSMSKVKEE